ncbi:hypothetical protein MTR_2g013990 [Medicago truncatula]|uniref:DUF4283 domain protein n=1 Tax=Medicago truncatula TaxID=3880 RepID=G7ISB6_MEDTR|nr:hypothetical protein MTR_2g013990 [Medicago truncatula]
MPRVLQRLNHACITTRTGLGGSISVYRWHTRKMVPLGKGYYDFHFYSAEDLKKIWAVGTVNLKPGLLRFSQWTKDFKFQATLKEIASAVGTPIDIDGPTRNRTFGHYARILVDTDLSKKAYDEILVEHDDFAFMVEIQYERRPLFSAKDKENRGKQQVKDNVAAPPKAPQSKDMGPSTSAIGGKGTWVPSVSSTVTATPITVNTRTQSIPVSLPAVPISYISSNSFSFPLHNVFDRIDRISTDESDRPTPVLVKVVSHVAHDDVQPVEAGRSQQTSWEVVENPMVSVVTNSPLDGVRYNLVNSRELVESPNGSIERVTHSSPLGREDVRLDGVEQTTQTSLEELEIPTVDDVSDPL